jgi:hypothetical protein
VGFVVDIGFVVMFLIIVTIANDDTRLPVLQLLCVVVGVGVMTILGIYV